MKRIILFFCFILSTDALFSQTNGTPVQFENAVRVPLKDVPVKMGSGWLNWFPTSGRLGVGDGGVYRFLTTDNILTDTTSSLYRTKSNTMTLAQLRLGYIANQSSSVQAVSFRVNQGWVNSNFSVGPTLGVSTSLLNSKDITGGSTAAGYGLSATIQSPVTVAAYGYRTSLSTAIGSYNVSSLAHFSAAIGSIGNGSSITNNYGFRVESSLIGATNNYGFSGEIPIGTGRYNLYMVGTAQNYLNGNLGLGILTPTERLDVSGNIRLTGNQTFVNLPNLSTGSFGYLTLNTTTGQVERVTSNSIANSSNFTASGNGSSTTISVPHGLTGVTSTSAVNVTARNLASSGIAYVTTDATNVNIFYTTAPASGTNNLLYTISLRP